MHNMFCPYPGLQVRLGELASLVDKMAEEAADRYDGARLDIAALPEMAVNGGRAGSAAAVSYPLEGPVLDVLGAKAREHHCYIVVPLYLVDDQEKGLYSNAAALVDRQGEVAGIYRKVFPVVDREGEFAESDMTTGSETAEGGVTPGKDFPVFDCDFGRVAIQICYDMGFDEGWEVLRRKSAELVIWPSQWPGQVHPGSRALRGRCFILSSTWRNNASLLDPTGHVLRTIREDGVFVEQIDLDYVIIGWHPRLHNGAAFDEKFGARAGHRYSEVEDCGIFWSNDPAMPIAEMVRALGLTTKPVEHARARKVLTELRGGPPTLD
jgi:predicted amidohydrolase